MELRYDLLTHGVYIVCAQHGGKKGGLAVAWATQVAQDRIMVCVGDQSATRPLILGAGAFGVSVLARGQTEIGRAFGRRSGRDVDKFEGVATHTAETGSPLLDDCVATFDCRVEQVFDLNSHKLIIGRIVASERRKAEYEPLIYRQDDY